MGRIAWMDRRMKHGWEQNGRSMNWTRALIVLLVLVTGLLWTAAGEVTAQTSVGQGGQATPGLSQSVAGQGGHTGQPAAGGETNNVGPGGDATTSNASAGGYTYDPSGRRDPFKPVGLEKPPPDNPDTPPLLRVGLTELNLIGIMWGGFGYTAMVQTPDGKGYTIRRGTRIGPNNGVVSAITENSIIVKEQYRDVYGKEQVREYIKHLHTKEGSE